jgi:OmpA-OmpF porin, OOP family
MRKIGFIMSAVTALLLGSASAADYEFTPLVGGDWPEGNLGLHNGEWIFGGEFQFNNLFESIKPEIAVLVSPDTEYLHTSDKTTISRFIVNGVHEYGAVNRVIPFVKAGLGYEYMSKKRYDNTDSVMADVGGGAKWPLTSYLALKLEALYMLKYNADRWDSNLAGLAGLTFSFGGAEAVAAAAPLDSDGDGVVDPDDLCPDTPAGVAVDAHGCIPDSERDGVLDTVDKCPDTPAGEAVDAHGCLLDSDHDGVPNMSDKCPDTPEGAIVDGLGCLKDSDKDGVSDLYDNCPNTPEGVKVDKVGCPIVKTLKLHFETGSAKIAADSEAKVAEFANFMKESPAYKVVIVGYTDSVGSEKSNMALSDARAESVKAMLVKDGVDPQRMRTEGKGEAQPVGNNATAEGRAENRRIEVWLLK